MARSRSGSTRRITAFRRHDAGQRLFETARPSSRETDEGLEVTNLSRLLAEYARNGLSVP